MPAPKARSAGPFSCRRTVQPRCLSAMAAVRPANPAPAISACRVLPWCRLIFAISLSFLVKRLVQCCRGHAACLSRLLILPHQRIEVGGIVDNAFLLCGIHPELD